MKQKAITVGQTPYKCITSECIKIPFNPLLLAYFGLRMASKLTEIHDEVGGLLVGGTFFWLPTKRGYPLRGGPWVEGRQWCQ